MRPQFLIVGAPKSGTTSLMHWLRQHPDVCMPNRELHYFGNDLGFTSGRIQSLESYLAQFENCNDRQAIGEKSTLYLMSRTAAQEIRDFNPQMKIIIMLREPSSFMYSLHGHTVYLGHEPYKDFEKALAAESARLEAFLAGNVDGKVRPGLLYRYAARFYEQVKRYQQLFPPSQIRFILMDDLKASASDVYRDVLTFLEVDPTFEADLSAVNESRQIKNARLQRLIRHPPRPIKRLGKIFLPLRTRQKIHGWFMRTNVREVRRPPLDPQLKSALQAEFRDEVLALSEMIGRDLSHWTPQT